MSRFFLNTCYLILLWAIGDNAGQSQELLVNVRHFSVEDGLSNRNVYSIVQDERDMIWIGTGSGLNRFDGKTFKLVEDQGAFLASGTIEGIRKDKDGLLWIQERHQNFVLFDPVTESVQAFSGEIPTNIEYLELLSRNGQLKKIYFTDEKKRVYHLDEHNNIVPFGSLQIADDELAKGTPWGTVLVYNRQNYLVKEINEQDQVVNQIRLPKLNLLKVGEIPLLKFNYSKEDTAYLHKLIYSYEKDGTVKPFSLKKNGNPIRISDFDVKAPFTFRSAIDHEGSIYLVVNDQLWLFDENGHFKKDLTENLREPPHEKNAFDEPIIDRQNRLWIGSSAGLMFVEVKENPFSQFLSDPGNISVRGITSIGDRHILAGTYSGSKVINIHDMTERHVNDRFALGFARLNDGTIIAGTHGPELLKFNQSGDLLPQIQTDHPFRTGYFMPHFSPTSNTIYIGCEQGLRYSKDNGRSIELYQLLNDHDDIKRKTINFFHQNQEGIWIGSSNGLYLLDEEKGLVAHHTFPFNHIKHINEDQDKNFWLATAGGGLIFWDRKDNHIRQYTTDDGLSNNVIYAAYPDEEGFLWLPSNKGLMRFEKSTGDVITFLPKDGLSHEEFNTFSHFQATNGRLFFGGLNGITSFHPNEIQIQENDAPFILTEVNKYDDATGKTINVTDEFRDRNKLYLNPENKFFTVGFSLLDYTASDHTFAWMIEGLENEWNYQNENSLRLNALPYGNFTLCIKAKSAGGKWAKNELKIPIHVLKPIYLKPWFITTVILASFSLLIIGFRWRINILKKNEKRLEALIDERTKELQQKNAELASLNRTKDRFFSIIAHDLRSPLVSLGGIAEKVNFLIKKNRHDEIQKIGDTVEEAVAHVHKLLDNLLNWAMVQGGRFPNHPTNIRAAEILEEVVGVYQNIAETKNIELNLDLTENPPLFCDRDALSTIVRNLLDNAIKFTPQAGKVHIGAFRKNSQTVIEVCDSGLGIAPEKIKYIFAATNDKVSTGTAGEKGTGLGLALCKELAEMNGGQIKVESKKGEGTTFFLIFPSKKNEN